jgi:hypothetical protein
MTGIIGGITGCISFIAAVLAILQISGFFDDPSIKPKSGGHINIFSDRQSPEDGSPAARRDDTDLEKLKLCLPRPGRTDHAQLGAIYWERGEFKLALDSMILSLNMNTQLTQMFDLPKIISAWAASICIWAMIVCAPATIGARPWQGFSPTSLS